MSEQCPGGCCPHEGATPDAECPDDLPGAMLPERAVHLYACQMLSTYKIAAITGTDRQRVTRLRARGVPIRTRGSYNREDRAMISPDDLTALYRQAGLSAEEVGDLLGVSRQVVLRSAYDQGLPVRVGGAPPARGPTEIELLAALYSGLDVRRVLGRHGVPVVATPGPIWERFPVPRELTTGLVTGLYEGCGLSLPHIELLTGRPMAAARSLLLTAGIQLRPAGGRCPFMRRWRQSGG